MGKALYLDLISGISGDMFVGALLDVGVSLQTLRADLKSLDLDGYSIEAHREERWSVSGVKFDVLLSDGSRAEDHPAGTEEGEQAGTTHDHGHSHSHSHGHAHSHAGARGTQRDFATIRAMINSSALSDWVKARSIGVFGRIAEAEGKVHGMPAERVHFHEVGAVDSIVDIVAACLCLESLKISKVLAAPVVEGRGWVNCAHGRFPAPTPATLEIFAARGVSVSQCEEPTELVTPTGAALLAEFAESFAPFSDFRVSRIGYGVGTRQGKTRPNILRAVLGESIGSNTEDDVGFDRDEVSLLETNLDDCAPETLGHFLGLAMEAGALDAFLTPLTMKKNRPGVMLSVLTPLERSNEFATLILKETTAFGVRERRVGRKKLFRESEEVETRYGRVAVKLGRLGDQLIRVAPEYESCRQVAAARGVSAREVMAEATVVARARWGVS